jgi:hypothetical protein
MEMSGHLHDPFPLPLGKGTGTHWIGGWADSRIGPEAWSREDNSCPGQELNTGSPGSSLSLYLLSYLRGLSPRANYTDRASAACRREVNDNFCR